MITNHSQPRIFRMRPVTRKDADGLYAPVDQFGNESGITPSHSPKVIDQECKRLNALKLRS